MSLSLDLLKNNLSSGKVGEWICKKRLTKSEWFLDQTCEYKEIHYNIHLNLYIFEIFKIKNIQNIFHKWLTQAFISIGFQINLVFSVYLSHYFVFLKQFNLEGSWNLSSRFSLQVHSTSIGFSWFQNCFLGLGRNIWSFQISIPFDRWTAFSIWTITFTINSYT